MANATDIITSIKNFSDIQEIAPNIGKSTHFSPALERQIKIHITPLVDQLKSPTTTIDDYSKFTLLSMLCNLECFSDEMLMAFCSTHYFGEPTSGESITLIRSPPNLH